MQNKNKVEIVKDFISAIEQGKFDQAENCLSDDFVFSGPVPKKMSKKDWLRLHKNLLMGIPNLKFNLTDLSESGNTVNASVRLSGTHSKEIPSLMPEVSAVPASNKNIQLPKENVTMVFKGDKISSFTVEKVPNGGVPGLLKQIGVTVPASLK
jgi:hypothetical protein